MTERDETTFKKLINCSFCNKSRNQVEQMVEGPESSGKNLYICNECVDITHKIIHKDSDVVRTKKRKEKILSPEQIKAHLDQYIIGQDDAKVTIAVAFYNHFKRMHGSLKSQIDKSNLLMIGESGSGKTLTIKTIANLFELPYVIADATSLTEAGYVGEDVDSLLVRLLKSAGGDLELAQKGIVFIDEIDKKSRKNESSTVSRDVSGEGVQQALLKIAEGTVIEIVDEFGETVDFDTKDVLFICSGAFVGLDDIIRANRTNTRIGIGAELKEKKSFSNVAKTVRPDDFVKYGLIPEFVGRHPVTVIFDDLTPSMMVRILKEPKDSIVSQFIALFKYEGVLLSFDDKYLQNVAEECLKQKIGARGLRSILERDLQSTQFILPRLAKEGVNKIFVDTNGAIKYVYKAKKRATNE